MERIEVGSGGNLMNLDHLRANMITVIIYPDEVDRRKAIGRVKRFIGCGTGPFRFCTFAFSPSSGDQEGYKGVGWTLWAWQKGKIYIWARFLKDWSFGVLKL